MSCPAMVIVTLGSSVVMMVACGRNFGPRQSLAARLRRAMSAVYGEVGSAPLWVLGQSTPQ